ncbi:MAG: heparinase II/III family protein, partial [Victivallales bacterium]|nr:heparinase II/III family protein [Victivallales bacterium]
AEILPDTAEVALNVHSLKSDTCEVDFDDVVINQVLEIGKEQGVVKPKTATRKTMNEDKMNHVDYKEIETAMELVEASVHPRLFTSGAAFEQLRHEAMEVEGIRHRMAERMKFLADSLLNVPELERVQIGRRILAISRLAIYRISTLALCYRLYGVPEYREKCVREMRAVSNFSDWNPSHFLDVAEMTLGLSIGYDWLYDELSDEDRGLISSAIINKGLKQINPNDSWISGTFNWTQVCWTGMLAGALATAELEPELCRHIVHGAIEHLAIPMSVYVPSGSYPEGMGYWHYGTGFNVIGLSMLQQAFGTTFGLAELPGFRETASYNDYIIGSSGFSYNYADCRPSRRCTVGATWWFAHYFEDPSLLSKAERQAFEEYLAAPKVENKSNDFSHRQVKAKEDSACSLMPIEPEADNGWYRALAFFWVFDDDGSEVPEHPLSWCTGGKVPLAIMRTSWDDATAVFVAAKGNSPTASHAHLDAGSFVVDAHGDRWLYDLGPELYHPVEALGLNLWSNAQDSDRWKLFRYNNLSHNTLNIDGHIMKAACNAPIVSFKDDGTRKTAVIDLSDAFSSDCTSALRTISLESSGVITVIDELKGLKTGANVCWSGITDKVVSSNKDKSITLSNGKNMVIITADEGQWNVVDVEHPMPPFKGDSPNPGMKRLENHQIAPDTGNVVMKITIRP